MQLDPSWGVDQSGEAQGMGLGEPKIRERLDAGIDVLGSVVVNPIGCHPLEKLGA